MGRIACMICFVTVLASCGGSSDGRDDAGVDGDTGCGRCDGPRLCGLHPDGCGGTLDCGPCRYERDIVDDRGDRPAVAVSAEGQTHVAYFASREDGTTDLAVAAYRGDRRVGNIDRLPRSLARGVEVNIQDLRRS